MSFNIKKIFGKIKSFADTKPTVCTKFTTTTDVYRAASDKKPALSFNNNGKLTFNIWCILAMIAGVVALCTLMSVSLNAKYKKKYKKKFEKIKAKYEKKEEKLLGRATEETEE